MLLLTRTAGFAYLNKVLIAEITSTIRSIPQEVSLGPNEGLSDPSVVNLDNIHVSKGIASRANRFFVIAPTARS